MLVLASFCAGAQIPELTTIRPLGLVSGVTNTITLIGENLSGATKLWTSFPPSVRSLEDWNDTVVTSTQVTIRVTIPPLYFLTGLPPVGIGALQLVISNGCTPFHLLMVDDMRSAVEVASNKTFAAAQRLDPPLAVDGNTDELSFDFYKFRAKKGQRLTIEVVAQRIGSRLDPVLRLLDAKTNEIAYCDDDPRIGRDSRLQLKVPATGEYVLEVRDINYGGGSQFQYRLRIGDFPVTSVPFPMAAVGGSNLTVSVLSPNRDDIQTAKVSIPLRMERVSVPVKYKRGSGWSWVSLLASSVTEISEREPNDKTNNATAISIPGALNGRFEQTNDVDFYRFEASKDQRLVFRGRNRSLGSPCDLYMEIHDTAGKMIAEYDPTGPDEGVLTNQFKEAGTYYLMVEELNRFGGPDLAYRIEVQPLLPGFDLSVDVNKLEISTNGTAELKVTAVRRNYDGPIQLSIWGADENALEIENVAIPEKKNEAQLKLKPAPSLAPGGFQHFEVRGTATISGETRTAVASTLPALRKLWPNLLYPPPELDGVIALSIRASESKTPAAKKKDDDEP